jgi:hypothetical protein
MNTPRNGGRSTLTLHRMDVPLPGGRILRLALTLDADGTPEDVVIAAGFPDGAALRDLAGGVALPASALPALRDALHDLDRNRMAS